MKRMLLCSVALLLVLSGCKQQAIKPTDPTQMSTQPSAAVQPSETTASTASLAPTVTTAPTESSAPTQTVAPTESTQPTETVKPTEPKPLTVSDWQLEAPEYLRYEEYFAEARAFSGGNWENSPEFWIKGNQIYTFDYDTAYSWERGEGEGLVVRCRASGGEYHIPGSETYGEYTVLGANGCYGFVRNSNRFLRIDLATGKAEVLLDRQNFSAGGGFFLCDNLVAYYTSYADGKLTIGRIYLPTLKNDVLYTVHGEYYDLSLSRPESNSGPIVWTLKNPEFVNFLRAELKNPNSKYKTHGNYDYSEYWKMADGLEQLLKEPGYMHYVQDDCGIPVRLKCTLDIKSGKVTQQTGIIDSCSHGSGYPHDHFNTEITTAPDPEIIMSDWVTFDTKAVEMLHREQNASPKLDVGYAVITDVDSSRYLYVRTDGDYKKLVDTPVSWVMNTGTCMIYATVDEQMLYAISYDGTQKLELLQATRGGFMDGDIGIDKNYAIFRDGDTLLALDLVNVAYRKLVSHPYLRSRYYIDSDYNGVTSYDSDKVYFEAYEGLYVGGFTIDIKTGELKAGYRL